MRARIFQAALIRCIARTTWRGAYLLAGVVWLSSASASAQVVVVLSSEAAPHRQAATAYNRVLQQHRVSITTVQFEALDDELLPQLLAENPKAFTAIGTEAAVSLQRRLPAEVPLTYCMVVQSGAAELISRPGTAGVSIDVPLKEQFALIEQALPRTRTVGMLYQPSSQRSSAHVEQVRRELPSNWRLVAISLGDHPSVADAVDALFRESIDVVWTAADSAVYDAATVRALLLTSVRRKVPVFGFSSGFVRAGALLGTSIDPAEQGRQCAEITQQLLERAPSADAAQRRGVQQHVSPRFRIEVNLVVAEMLGVDLPDELVRSAHHVIRPE